MTSLWKTILAYYSLMYLPVRTFFILLSIGLSAPNSIILLIYILMYNIKTTSSLLDIYIIIFLWTPFWVKVKVFPISLLKTFLYSVSSVFFSSFLFPIKNKLSPSTVLSSCSISSNVCCKKQRCHFPHMWWSF